MTISSDEAKCTFLIIHFSCTCKGDGDVIVQGMHGTVHDALDYVDTWWEEMNEIHAGLCASSTPVFACTDACKDLGLIREDAEGKQEIVLMLDRETGDWWGEEVFVDRARTIPI